MLALHELQSGFSRAILSDDAGAIGDHIAAPGANPMDRLAIYRNNTFLSLTYALMATFPAVVRVVDARFFRYLAHAFIKAHPPRQPMLSQYGGGLATFIADFDACRALPYLADLARLEWAINEAALQPLKSALSPGAIGAIAPELLATARLTLQPSLRLVVSRWPVLAIWQANQTAHSVQAMTVARSANRILLLRKGAGVVMDSHSASRSRFVYALNNGATIETAMAAALVRDPGFVPTTELLDLFSARLVTGISTAKHHI
jgi:hypothetical protein